MAINNFVRCGACGLAGAYFSARHHVIRCKYCRAVKVMIGGQPPSLLAVAQIAGTLTSAESATPTDDSQPSRRQDAATLLLAVENMEMIFQPIVAVRTGEAIGYEALARFSVQSHRSPRYWFAKAASLSLGVELEIAAARRALSCLADVPGDSFLSINLSAAALTSDAFAQLVEQLPLDRVMVELTEHEPVRNYGALGRAIAGLRNRGLRLAVDDAGAGQGGLQHLLNLEPEMMKLDRELITDLDRDRPRQALIASLVAFANRGGTTVVAEGVETSIEAAALQALGVPCAQGNYYAHPAVLDRLLPAAIA